MRQIKDLVHARVSHGLLLAFVGLLLGALVLLGAAVAWAPVAGWAWAAAVLGVVWLALLAWSAHALVHQALWSEEERQRLELQLHCLREGIEALPFGVAIYDQHDRLVLFNSEAAEQIPYREGGDLIGQTFEALIRRALARGAIAEALGREEELLRERLAGRGQLERPLLRQRQDGRWMRLYELRTPSGCLVMARLDVSELVHKTEALQRSNALLQQLSATDALTGLPLSLLMIDIDHFKRYNDLHGHVAGDACLRQVAGILYDCAQRSGELVARYGGEEFALLLPGADGATALTVAQRCMEELARAAIPHGDSPVSPYLTCSIGVATVVARAELVPESLVRCADEALYQVKSRGRAQIESAACPA